MKSYDKKIGDLKRELLQARQDNKDDKKIGDLKSELLQARQDNNIEKGKDPNLINCKVCNKTLKDKLNLTKHIKLMHPKTHIWVNFPRTGITPKSCLDFGVKCHIRTPLNFIRNFL